MGVTTTNKLGLEQPGVRKANNAGLVAMNAAVANFVLHTMPTTMISTAKVRKIMAFNNTGAATFLQLGYLTLAAVFVQTIPDLLCLAAVENIWTEADIPNYEWRPDTTLVTGTLGDIVAQITVCPANQVRIILEVEELRQ